MEVHIIEAAQFSIGELVAKTLGFQYVDMRQNQPRKTGFFTDFLAQSFAKPCVYSYQPSEQQKIPQMKQQKNKQQIIDVETILQQMIVKDQWQCLKIILQKLAA